MKAKGEAQELLIAQRDVDSQEFQMSVNPCFNQSWRLLIQFVILSKT